MLHRFALVLLVVITCWPQTGCAVRKAALADVNSQYIVPLPSTEKTEARPTIVANAGTSDIRQAAYLSQPEYPQNFGGLAGSVGVDTLVQYALDNNPEIQAARYHARALAARVPQSVSLPDPQLMTNTFLQEIQTASGPQQVALSLSQKIPWIGKRSLRG